MSTAQDSRSVSHPGQHLVLSHKENEKTNNLDSDFLKTKYLESFHVYSRSSNRAEACLANKQEPVGEECYDKPNKDNNHVTKPAQQQTERALHKSGNIHYF
jgi:hypothetical protein